MVEIRNIGHQGMVKHTILLKNVMLIRIVEQYRHKGETLDTIHST